MKKLCSLLLCALLCACLCLPAAATEDKIRLNDRAGLLTAAEAARVEAHLDILSEELEFDLVVLIVPSIGYQSEVTVADDFYDENGYGYGNEYDGALLLISPFEDICYISTCGEGISAIDPELSRVSQNFRVHWNKGKAELALIAFADTCAELVQEQRTFGRIFIFVGSPLLAFIVAIITVSVMKSKLKSVRYQTGAADYARPGSMHITESHDLFLYRNVSRRARPKNNGSGGSHVSSSGRSHGGGRI